jgi:hypothetical protein
MRRAGGLPGTCLAGSARAGSPSGEPSMAIGDRDSLAAQNVHSGSN